MNDLDGAQFRRLDAARTETGASEGGGHPLLRERPPGSRPVLQLAPMAGVSDKPMRVLARRFGADVVTGEMISGRADLRDLAKTLHRRDREGESGPIVTQILGADPREMAASAKFYADEGADVVDVNMGCPAKKVLKKWAGSALMGDPPLVREILERVVEAAGVPVTLKTRLGPSADRVNVEEIARIASRAGVRAITVHGRTREQGFKGEARYGEIAALKRVLDIPVTVNGDVDSPAKALDVARLTGADAIMIGRAAEGRPWIFREVARALETGRIEPVPYAEAAAVALEHLEMMHAFYGEERGLRVARRHIKKYLGRFGDGAEEIAGICAIADAARQRRAVRDFLMGARSERDWWPEAPEAAPFRDAGKAGSGS